MTFNNDEEIYRHTKTNTTKLSFFSEGDHKSLSSWTGVETGGKGDFT